MFRLHLVNMGVNDCALVFTAHHIVVRRLVDRRRAARLGRAVQPARQGRARYAAPPDSFSAYARARAETGNTGREGHEAYWTQQFTGEIPGARLPYDRLRPPRKTYRAGREDLVIDAALVAEVRKTGAKSKASLFATLLAGFKALAFDFPDKAIW